MWRLRTIARHRQCLNFSPAQPAQLTATLRYHVDHSRLQQASSLPSEDNDVPGGDNGPEEQYTPRTFPFIDPGPVSPEVKSQIYPKHLPDALRDLKPVFNFKGFRGQQEEILSRVFHGGNAFVVMPTGAGKSFIFQKSALDLKKAGSGDWMVVVVGPLDQVASARKLGIVAEGIQGTMKNSEMKEAWQRVQKGEVEILFLTPDTLVHSKAILALPKLKGHRKLLCVIDEAHCIPQDGPSYRSNYLAVPSILRPLADRTLLLTASATSDEIDDLCRAFLVPNSEGVFRTSPYRPNLELDAVRVSCNEQKKEIAVEKLKNMGPGKAIIYTTTRADVKAITQHLKSKFPDRKIHPYHSRIHSREGKKVLADMQSNEDCIVVSTTAFGLGVNIPDVRLVMHYSIPMSMAQYMQQVGRAGRDGKKSSGLVLVSDDDLRYLERMIRGSSMLNRKTIRDFVEHVCEKFQGGTERVVETMKEARKFSITEQQLDQLYRYLQYHQPYQYLRDNFREATWVKYYINEKSFDRFKKAAQTDDSSEECSALLHHSAPQDTNNLFKVSIKDTAEKTDLVQLDLDNKLRDLRDRSLLSVVDNGVRVKYVTKGCPNRLPTDSAGIEKLTDELTAEFARRLEKQLAESQNICKILSDATEISNTVGGNRCIHQAIASHYGYDIPTERRRCGHCSGCRGIPPTAAMMKSWPPKNRKQVVAEDHAVIAEIYREVKEAVRKKMNASPGGIVGEPDMVLGEPRGDAEVMAGLGFGLKLVMLQKLRLGPRSKLWSALDHWGYDDLLDACRRYVKTKEQ